MTVTRAQLATAATPGEAALLAGQHADDVSGGGGGGVTSFNGRTGAVAPTTGDYTASQVGALAATKAAVIGTGVAASDLGGKSLLNSTAVKTAAYTASAWDLVRVDISAGSFAVTLPSASTKWEVVVKVAAAAAVSALASTACTVTAAGTDVINSAGTATLPLRYLDQSKTFASDGAGTITASAGDFSKTINDQLYDGKALQGGSRFAASMADEVAAPAAYPTITDLGTTTTSYSGTPITYPAVVSSAANPLFRYLLNSPGVSGSSVVPYAAPIGAAARAIAFNEPLAVAFDFDGLSFEVGTTKSTASTAFRVWVNEQQSATVPLPAASGATKYKVIVGTTRVVRRIVVEFDTYAVFTSIACASTDTVLSPEDGAVRKVAYIGDSYSWGQGYASGGASARSLFSTFARVLGFGHYRRFSAPASGMVATGSYSAYPARLNDVIAYAPDVVIVQGSINDNTLSGVQAAATSIVQTLQTGLPNARILLTGVMRSYGTTTADTTTNTAIQAAATALGVSYVDPTNWCTGTGSVTTPNGSGNSDVYNYSFSADHPSAPGHRYLGRRLAAAVSGLFGQTVITQPQPLAEATQAALAALPTSSGSGYLTDPAPAWNGYNGWVYDPFLISAAIAPVGGSIYVPNHQTSRAAQL